MNEKDKNYSYLSFDLSFKESSNDVLAKAVRVTNTVKDKIKSGFKKNFTVSGIEQKQVEAIQSQVAAMENSGVVSSDEDTGAEGGRKIDYIVSKAVDETEEGLIALSNKLKELETQKKVVVFVKRMALYTRELVELTKKSMVKWFGFLNKQKPEVKAEEPVVAPVVEQPVESKNNLYDWSSALKETPQEVSPVVEQPIPTVEPVVEQVQPSNVIPFVQKEVELPKEEVKAPIPFELPKFESGPEITKIELPKEEEEPKRVEITPTMAKEPLGFSFDFLNREEPKEEIEPEEESLTGNRVLAKAHSVADEFSRLRNSNMRKDEKIKLTQSKLEDAEQRSNAYKEVNRDLSDRVNLLTSRLDSMVADREKMKKAFIESAKKHNEEMEDLNNKYEKLLKTSTEDKERLIKEHSILVEDMERKHNMEMEKRNAEYKSSLEMIYNEMRSISDAVKVPTSRVEEPAEQVVPQYGQYDRIRSMAA